MKKIALYLICTVLGLAVGCRKPFQYSLLEVRPLAREMNVKAVEEIVNLPPKDVFSFLLISDSQVGYKELEDFVAYANRIYSKDEVSFVLHGGDITDFGANYEYNDYYGFTTKLKFPLVATIGNHDMLGNGSAIYNKAFGPENFTFDFGKNRFIIFNSNSRERGFDGTLPNLPWLQQQLDREDLTDIVNIFYLSHVDPLSPDFDPQMTQKFADIVSSTDKARLAINGHAHVYKLTTPFNDGLQYLIIPAIHTRSFVKIDVVRDEITVNLISY